MSSRLLRPTMCCQVRVSKSLREDKLINTEPSRTGWWKVRGKREKGRKGGRKVVGKSRRSFTIFLSTCVPGQVTDWRSRAV